MQGYVKSAVMALLQLSLTKARDDCIKKRNGVKRIAIACQDEKRAVAKSHVHDLWDSSLGFMLFHCQRLIQYSL